ncbi:caffeic acid 3-O-methyltransferase [Helianthus annuus]|uniref:Putative O-methyltransferase COMT-type, S-adenosyl-L-methionine-dependent methyltransferase n=1 Tax=Helianthus annuus TaxID=4232 RepID=A0A251TEW5_HELAN|nr:caffeic acid 3-O-methyltransferase [Helianthus annuus]
MDSYKMIEEEEGLLRVNQINGGIVLPMVIKTAIELDLFEIMAKTPGSNFSCFDLASSLPKQTHETPALIERILRFLASHSVLTSTVVKDEHGDSRNLYGMTAMSNNYVRKQDGTSHASSVLLLYDKVLVDCWHHLKDAVIEGGVTFDKAHGVNAFEYPAKDNRFNSLFNKCMYNNTRIVMKMILEKYKGFEGVKELIDVGGGLGANLELIVSKYPSIKGTNFDLPHVIKDAPPYPGVEHVGGDMFQSVPKGDVIFMKWILHDWGDNYCIKLLKNCWAALPDCGRVVVVEAIIPDQESDSSCSDEVSKTVIGGDMIMLIANPGGKERTAKEYNVLAKEAGFTSMEIVCRVSMFWIMEFYKNN